MFFGVYPAMSRALMEHEQRMVGSRTSTERYVFKQAYKINKRVAEVMKMPQCGFEHLATELAGQTVTAVRDVIETQLKYFLAEKFVTHTWNKYQGTSEWHESPEFVRRQISKEEYEFFLKNPEALSE